MRRYYAIRDAKVGAYDRLYEYRTDAEAVRALQTTVNMDGRESMIAVHPDDYSLWAICEIDEETGKMNQPEDWPRHVTNASALVKVEK